MGSRCDIDTTETPWIRWYGGTMAVSRMRPSPLSPVPPASDDATVLTDEVELYHRTYTTLLRSSGETRLKVLEPSHATMGSSLHSGAGSIEPDLGAFLYATHRLPGDIWRAGLVLLGDDIVGIDGVTSLDEWTTVEARARRRLWHTNGLGTFAVLIASSSDLDDLIPTLVAYQIEWNKLHLLVSAAGDPAEHALKDAASCAEAFGGSEVDWQRLIDSWDGNLDILLRRLHDRELDLRIQMHGGSAVGYARVTRRWWEPVLEHLQRSDLLGRPIYFVSSNTHSITNLLTGTAELPEEAIVAWLERDGPPDLQVELHKLAEGRSKGSWANFLYFCARSFRQAQPENRDWWEARQALERSLGITHLPSRNALRVAAQVIEVRQLDPDVLDARLGAVDAARLRESDAVIVNIDYPLGLAAYNVLRQVGESTDDLRGVYVLGKAATLNAAVGDVMISNVVHDEHSGSTYWLDNAFSFEDIAPFLQFGSGLDNQRAVTVRSTFLQNRGYLEFYYREAFTVVEMEAGPFCDALFEIVDVGRYPVGAAVNFSKLPVDFGIIHYASDTPYTQARTLGAQGMSYFGMDATYASSLAIVHRILDLEKLLAPPHVLDDAHDGSGPTRAMEEPGLAGTGDGAHRRISTLAQPGASP